MKRQSGILMPIFSLPSKYGIGDFGKESYKFVDTLSSCGQKLWQILPLVQTGYGNSPYSSVCSYSFNPYFISPEILLKKKLVTKEEVAFCEFNCEYVDYGNLYVTRFPLLEKAFSRFDKNDSQFKSFVKSKKAYDYALYMTLKYASGQKHFYEWADEYKYRDKTALKRFANEYSEKILYWQFIQFEARNQWLDLKKYANSKGVSILGDMPLYVALDSIDVWCNPELYKIDDNFVPKKIAGVPPDYFCADGQLWGNPVYDYEEHKKDGFSWWTNRLKKALEIYDYVRIDHFRGLDRYYQVDNGRENARVGEWIDVPSDELFSAINKKIKKDRIIAEDLGIIDDGVRTLLAKTGYPGMKILSFAFNGQEDNLYLPKNVTENSVCYTGTHDNNTLRGLIEGASEWDLNNLVWGVTNSLKEFKIKGKTDSEEGLINSIIELGYATKSKLMILPVQDVLSLGGEYRINEPGTVKAQNWAVRFNAEQLKSSKFLKIKNLTKKYKRI